MQILFDESGCPETFRSNLASLAKDPEIQTIVVLACDENAWDPLWLEPLLTQSPKPILGGIFPQIIYKTGNYQRGTLCFGLRMTLDYCVLQGLSETSMNATNERILQAASESWQRESKGTLMVMVDGLSTHISALLHDLFDHFALDKNIIGGGAGSLSLVQKPCILTPQGLLADAALLINLPLNSALGVAHGWEPISPSFKVTESDRNIIRSLDWRPALEVYAEVVREHRGEALDTSDFFATSKAYPFGIKRMGHEMIVRDPIAIDDTGGLVCVGEVAEGSFVHVLHGDAQHLIAAASQARDNAEQKTTPEAFTEHPAIILIDCISRALFLEDRMSEELSAVSHGSSSLMIGAMTLGEIANNGEDYLEFYNKTCVVCLMETV